MNTYSYKSQLKAIKILPGNNVIDMLPKQGDLYSCIIKKQVRIKDAASLPKSIGVGEKLLYLSTHLIVYVDEGYDNTPEIVYYIEMFNLNSLEHQTIELGRIYGKDIDVEKAAYDNKDYFFTSMLNFKMFFKKE